MADEEAASAPAAAPPSWRAHVVALAVPEGMDPAALLGEIEGGSRPLFKVVDVETLPGADGTPEGMATALAQKLAEDKSAGIEAKQAAIEAAAAEAAEKAAAAAERQAKIDAGEEVEPEPEPEPEPEAAEGEGEEAAFKDEPPPVERSADVYYVLKAVPDGLLPALATAEVGIDSLISIEMDTAGLAVYGGEPPPDPKAPPPEPAEGEEPPEPPTPLPPSALAEAPLGQPGSGLEGCALLTLSPSVEAWADLTAVFSSLSAIV